MSNEQPQPLTLEEINKQLVQLQQQKLEMARQEIAAICQKYSVELTAVAQLRVQTQ